MKNKKNYILFSIKDLFFSFLKIINFKILNHLKKVLILLHNLVIEVQKLLHINKILAKSNIVRILKAVNR